MLCCPKCGSIEVFEEIGGYAGTMYRCKKCGYRGALIVEVDGEEDRKEHRDRRHLGTKRG
jgi:uncharacterized Zn finger protein